MSKLKKQEQYSYEDYDKGFLIEWYSGVRGIRIGHFDGHYMRIETSDLDELIKRSEKFTSMLKNCREELSKLETD